MEKIDFRAVKQCRPSIVTEEDSGRQDTTCKRLCLSLKKKPNRFATVSNEEMKAAANGVVPETQNVATTGLFETSVRGSVITTSDLAMVFQLIYWSIMILWCCANGCACLFRRRVRKMERTTQQLPCVNC